MRNQKTSLAALTSFSAPAVMALLAFRQTKNNESNIGLFQYYPKTYLVTQLLASIGSFFLIKEFWEKAKFRKKTHQSITYFYIETIMLHIPIVMQWSSILLFLNQYKSNSLFWFNSYGFLDKRYLLVSHLAIVAISVGFLYQTFNNRDVSTTTQYPKKNGIKKLPETVLRDRLLTAFLKTILVLTCWYLTFPLPKNEKGITLGFDIHSVVQYKSFQAISNGNLPYVGNASNQYGPGTQILTYFLSAWGKEQSMQSIMYANFTLFSLFVLFFFLNIVFIFRLKIALMIMIANVFTSAPLSFMYWVNSQQIGGFFGWSNLGRYLLPTLISLLLANQWRKNNLWKSRGFYFGAVFTFLIWVAQENIVPSLYILTVYFFALKFIFKQSLIIELKKYLPYFYFTVLMCFSWIILVKRENISVTEYFSNYLLIPKLVGQGYTNTFWTSTRNFEYFQFLALPCLMLLLTLFFAYLLKSSMNLQGQKSLESFYAFLGILLSQATLISYLSSLTRSDSYHYENTLTSVPTIFILFVVLLFKKFDFQKVSFINRSKLILVSSLLLFLITKPALLDIDQNKNRFMSSFQRAINLDNSDKTNFDSDLFVKKVGYLPDSFLKTSCCGNLDATWSELITAANAIRNFSGGKKVYIDENIPGYFPEVLYFLADLKMGEAKYDRLTMVVNLDLYELNRQVLLRNIGDIDVFVTASKNTDSNFYQAMVRSHGYVSPREKAIKLGSETLKMYSFS